MPLTLSYLPLRARAESLRMILRYCNIAFVDNVVSLEQWGPLKASGKLPPGNTGNVQLPVLELEDGTFMPESLDIAKYIWTTLAGKPVTGSDPDHLWLLSWIDRCAIMGRSRPHSDLICQRGSRA